MKEIINHVNEKLSKHCLQINENDVLSQHNIVIKKWLEVIESFKKKPINYLIVGEATVSFDNYFYNENSKSTSFLNPSHFKCKNKADLIQFFQENGILVFDLYPLPLPTFIYDKVKFDCENVSYKKALEEYYNMIMKVIDDNTVIVPRYSKLYNDRGEWNVFMGVICRDKETYQSIASENMGADFKKIEKVFQNIIKN